MSDRHSGSAVAQYAVTLWLRHRVKADRLPITMPSPTHPGKLPVKEPYYVTRAASGDRLARHRLPHGQL